MRLAYTTSDAPGRTDRVFEELARRLAAEGLRPVGAVQVNTPRGPDLPCDMELLLLPDGPRIGISQSLGPGSAGCRLDIDGLERSVQESSHRLADGADLLIVNKFGSHEAEGRGFRDLIGTALAEGVPVLIGVTSAKLPAFLDFAENLCEAVPCDVDALHAWVRAAPDR